MKAVRMHQTGPADQLRLDEVETPQMSSQDIEVTVAAAAVNPVDVKTRSGFLKLDISLPAILGWDVSGVVSRVGSDVSRFREGDHVIGMIAQPSWGRGTYSETVVADEKLFALAPTSISLVDAAALPLTVLTAQQVISKLRIPSPANVLVTGAAGAVGNVVCQLLRNNGHQVSGIARPQDGRELESRGITPVTSTWTDQGNTWDAVVDTAGLKETITAVRDNGTFISIADTEQPQSVRGIEPEKSYVNEDGETLSSLVALVDEGSLEVPVGRLYPLSDVANAHADLEAGGIRGKLVLVAQKELA